MDELTIAWAYAHLWLHIFRRGIGHRGKACPFCGGARTMPSKPRY